MHFRHLSKIWRLWVKEEVACARTRSKGIPFQRQIAQRRAEKSVTHGEIVTTDACTFKTYRCANPIHTDVPSAERHTNISRPVTTTFQPTDRENQLL